MIISLEKIEYLMLICIAAVALLFVAATNNKVSPNTLRKLLYEYEDLTDDGNYYIKEISQKIDFLLDRHFVSRADEEQAIKLIETYQSLYNKIFEYSDQMGVALKKRKVKQFRKFQKQASEVLKQLQETLDSLCEVSKFTQSKVEWEYKERIRQAEEEHRNRQQRINDEQESTYRKKTYITKPLQTYSDIFFADCHSRAEMDKKYRSLAKKYHPDMPTGDKETFQKMLEEYERKKSTL